MWSRVYKEEPGAEWQVNVGDSVEMGGEAVWKWGVWREGGLGQGVPCRGSLEWAEVPGISQASPCVDLEGL